MANNVKFDGSLPDNIHILKYKLDGSFVEKLDTGVSKEGIGMFVEENTSDIYFVSRNDKKVYKSNISEIQPLNYMKTMNFISTDLVLDSNGNVYVK